MASEPHTDLPISGHFPGWAAIFGMAAFPLIGIPTVALTTWKPITKVIVSVVGTALWILIAVLLIRNQRAGPA